MFAEFLYFSNCAIKNDNEKPYYTKVPLEPINLDSFGKESDVVIIDEHWIRFSNIFNHLDDVLGDIKREL